MSDRTWMEHGTIPVTAHSGLNYVVVRRPSPDAHPLYDVHLAGDRFKVRLVVLTGFLTCSCHRDPCLHRAVVMEALGQRSKRSRKEAMERMGEAARQKWGSL